MQTLKSSRENFNAQSSRFVQRIGSTVFTVNVISKEGKQEALEDKVLRLIKRDLEFGGNYGENSSAALKMAENRGMMVIPQADWLPERGSL